MWQLAGAVPGDTSTMFPISDDPKRYTDEAKPRLKHVPVELHALIEALQPYHAPEPTHTDLWAITCLTMRTNVRLHVRGPYLVPQYASRAWKPDRQRHHNAPGHRLQSTSISTSRIQRRLMADGRTRLSHAQFGEHGQARRRNRRAIQPSALRMPREMGFAALTSRERTGSPPTWASTRAPSAGPKPGKLCRMPASA